MIVHIIGASGSGKSTLGKALSEKTGLPLLSSDHYLWPDSEFKTPRPVSRRVLMLKKDMEENPSFILEGGISWFAPNAFSPDLIILLRCENTLRLRRLCKRETMRYGNWQDPSHPHHQLTREFLSWCSLYEKAGYDEPNSLCSHMRLLSQSSCPCVILQNSGDIPSLVKKALACLELI